MNAPAGRRGSGSWSRVPLPPTLRGYRRNWLRRDLVAAATVWAVLVPESLAYAAIAGVPPVVGLYAAVPALVLYALIGTSRHLVVAPMSATAALSASVVATYAGSGAVEVLRVTVTLSLVVGLLGILAGLLRLGFLSAFISAPVLKGFVIGLALTILVGQLPHLLGVERGEGSFFGALWQVVAALPALHLPTAVVGLLALAVILLLRRVAPWMPGSLCVVVLGVVV